MSSSAIANRSPARQSALEEEFKKERTHLRADLEKEKQVWLAERERQVQELAQEKSRLEQYFADRQAQLLKEREAESQALQDNWTRTQNEWLLEHQTALQKNESAFTSKLRETEVTLEERRQTLDKEYQRRELHLSEGFAVTEKTLRQELGEKTEALRQQYQAMLAENIGQNNHQLEEHRKNLQTLNLNRPKRRFCKRCSLKKSI